MISTNDVTDMQRLRTDYMYSLRFSNFLRPHGGFPLTCVRAHGERIWDDLWYPQRYSCIVYLLVFSYYPRSILALRAALGSPGPFTTSLGAYAIPLNSKVSFWHGRFEAFFGSYRWQFFQRCPSVSLRAFVPSLDIVTPLLFLAPTTRATLRPSNHNGPRPTLTLLIRLPSYSPTILHYH